MQAPTRSSLELCYVIPEVKNEVFHLHKETEFPQKFFSVPFLERKGTPVRRGRCQRDLKHAKNRYSIQLLCFCAFFSFAHL